MSGYILRDSEPSIVLTADQVDRLVKNGDGDAALLYLLLMRQTAGSRSRSFSPGCGGASCG